jgi:LmbE family N-acetylglucosaminyl deacetylase
MGVARRTAQAALNAVQKRVGVEVADADLRADAWVIAPHPDDEVLGCGGTIARKAGQGAKVRVCFLTDGAASHDQRVAKADLRALREAEAVSACAELGVARDDIVFLGFEDGNLAKHEGVAELRSCFQQWPVVEVYAPHHREGPEDHRAACRVARAAMGGLAEPSICLEYPVWCWNEWPWVEASGVRETVRAPPGFVRSLRLVHECRWRVPIEEVREQKRRALDCHRTQMFGPEGVDDCPTLASVGDGEFIKRFFSSHEIFARYAVPATITKSPTGRREERRRR